MVYAISAMLYAIYSSRFWDKRQDSGISESVVLVITRKAVSIKKASNDLLGCLCRYFCVAVLPRGESIGRIQAGKLLPQSCRWSCLY